jgi:hypothetical protein
MLQVEKWKSGKDRQAAGGSSGRSGSAIFFPIIADQVGYG